jgi:hypothetical protein
VAVLLVINPVQIVVQMEETLHLALLRLTVVVVAAVMVLMDYRVVLVVVVAAVHLQELLEQEIHQPQHHLKVVMAEVQHLLVFLVQAVAVELVLLGQQELPLLVVTEVTELLQQSLEVVLRMLAVVAAGRLEQQI